MSQYTILETLPAMGRTQVVICHLSCGKTLQVYLWSFAGHGFKRCPHCHEKIFYNPETRRESSPSQGEGGRVDG